MCVEYYIVWRQSTQQDCTTIGNYLTNEFLLEMAFGHAKLAIKNDRTRQGDGDLANWTAEKYNYMDWEVDDGDRNGDDRIIRFFGWTNFWALPCTRVVDKCLSKRITLVWGRTHRVSVNGG